MSKVNAEMTLLNKAQKTVRTCGFVGCYSPNPQFNLISDINFFVCNLLNKGYLKILIPTCLMLLEFPLVSWSSLCTPDKCPEVKLQVSCVNFEISFMFYLSTRASRRTWREKNNTVRSTDIFLFRIELWPLNYLQTLTFSDYSYFCPCRKKKNPGPHSVSACGQPAEWCVCWSGCSGHHLSISQHG